jgi:hypothetical protein
VTIVDAVQHFLGTSAIFLNNSNPATITYITTAMKIKPQLLGDFVH